MFMMAFFSWWYGEGWKGIAASLDNRLEAVASTFSVNQLIRTLFAPWRRIITYPGASLEDKFHAWVDNLFSRTVGFAVRLLVLLSALIISIVIGLETLLEIVLWPLLPFGFIILIILGIIW